MRLNVEGEKNSSITSIRLSAFFGEERENKPSAVRYLLSVALEASMTRQRVQEPPRSGSHSSTTWRSIRSFQLSGRRSCFSCSRRFSCSSRSSRPSLMESLLFSVYGGNFRRRRADKTGLQPLGPYLTRNPGRY